MKKSITGLQSNIALLEDKAKELSKRLNEKSIFGWEDILIWTEQLERENNAISYLRRCF